MEICRVVKTKDYTVMSNYHLRDRRLSAKEMGLLSFVLSLPDDWDFTIRGLIGLLRDGKDSIYGALRNLETFGVCPAQAAPQCQGAAFPCGVFLLRAAADCPAAAGKARNSGFCTAYGKSGSGAGESGTGG